ncbi:FAD-binding protein [Nannocystis sp. ILAH1]|uniref:NAD(P)/FAD-dependent oxidoreductase n=1 Tax=Nannocystis sp. ILAH1 TaxID=2996789 RepID=UPI002271D7AB|nr:FAD-binding protein [Nannocystis sp. ILAH1]
MSSAVQRVRVDLHPDALLDPDALRRAGACAAGLREADVRHVAVAHRSIDARRGRVRVHVELIVYVGKDMPEEPCYLPHVLPNMSQEPAVVIVGAGPAGMFCAWGLARAGVRSVVLERGRDVRTRRHDLAGLSQRGELDPESNYCFGEGGAGTFSDGKLYTRATKRGPVDLVLRAFAGYGAPAEILVDARPHIGTNRLPRVVTAMREHLIGAGVEFRFEARADALVVHDGAAAGVRLRGGEVVPARAVVVAPGHSARDVQAWLRAAGVKLSFKSFALGVRIEHPQALIDHLQYGALAGHPALGAASYRLVEQTAAGAAFSFCMCPGGYIVPAATDPGMQVVNGMSPHSRRGKFANSGLVTEVGPQHLAAAGLSPDDPLAGVEYQARFEAEAYRAGGGAFVAPAQRLANLVAGAASRDLPATSYHRGLQPARLDRLLGPLGPPLQSALQALGARMPGFLGDDAIAVGVESRTSCPVRVDRDGETLESPSTPQLYPCGEGAGFAGGIVSAALDGLRVAVAIARRLGAPHERITS